MTARTCAITTVAAVGLVAMTAQASPKVGAARPNIVVSDAWDRTFDLSTVGTRPLLVLYEGQGVRQREQGAERRAREGRQR